jgi:hypothetical protein
MRTILAGPHLSAGHGVHRSNRVAPVGARCARPPLASGTGSIGSRVNDLRARAARSYERCSNGDVSAGHGLHRSGSHPQPIGVHPRPSAAKPYFSAGHGVHRSNPQSRPSAPVRPSRRDRLHSSASIGGLTYAVPLGMGSIA